MEDEISCPICGLVSISSDEDRCPQCDADLSCFKVLSSLPDETVGEENARGKRVPAWAFVILFIGVIITIIGFQFYWFRRYEILLRHYQSAMVTTLEDLMQNRPSSGAIHLDVSPEGEPAEGDPKQLDFWLYRVKEGDTLWDIAKLYYGSGRYYPVLLEHNTQLEVYALRKGSRIKILNNSGRAEDEYAGIVVREGDKTYFDYTVKKGDTLESLAVKFYKTEKFVNLIFELNPNLQLKAGETIKILLK